MNRVDRDDSPVVMEAMSVGTTIDLGRNGSTDRGAYIEAYISRVESRPVRGRARAGGRRCSTSSNATARPTAG